MTDRTLVALLVPADPDQPIGLHLLPDASVAYSDVLGGGLLAEPEVWLLDPQDPPGGVRRVHVYRRDGRPDGTTSGAIPGTATPAPNRRLAALADLLAVRTTAPPGRASTAGTAAARTAGTAPTPVVPGTDALLLGGRDDGGDTDVPTVVLATALHSGWPVQMDVSATGDREAGETRW